MKNNKKKQSNGKNKNFFAGKNKRTFGPKYTKNPVDIKVEVKSDQVTVKPE